MNPPRRLRGTFGMCNLREGFVNLREGFVVAPWRLREAFSKTRSAKASRSPLEGFAKASRRRHGRLHLETIRQIMTSPFRHTYDLRLDSSHTHTSCTQLEYLVPKTNLESENGLLVVRVHARAVSNSIIQSVSPNETSLSSRQTRISSHYSCPPFLLRPRLQQPVPRGYVIHSINFGPWEEYIAGNHIIILRNYALTPQLEYKLPRTSTYTHH